MREGSGVSNSPLHRARLGAASVEEEGYTADKRHKDFLWDPRENRPKPCSSTLGDGPKGNAIVKR